MQFNKSVLFKKRALATTQQPKKYYSSPKKLATKQVSDGGSRERERDSYLSWVISRSPELGEVGGLIEEEKWARGDPVMEMSQPTVMGLSEVGAGDEDGFGGRSR
ncbi:uncharacterized protein A4U43_C04F27910 [Asparagus officinalis]|uniref:Uncharacterized protein n=1 Tax=Asparagus officinalis TaxID=4686 RepID=A0A5P1F4R3_ASPOF|nr:uncharacterized protein A4U43_C04F27910 [Asparagus officinalis]